MNHDLPTLYSPYAKVTSIVFLFVPKLAPNHPSFHPFYVGYGDRFVFTTTLRAKTSFHFQGLRDCFHSITKAGIFLPLFGDERKNDPV
jgi:hypothetical protein